MTINIAGLKVDPFTKDELLRELESNIKKSKQTWLLTAYSEFLHAALLDKNIMELLNSADIVTADGISIIWTEKYLSLPLRAHSYYTKILVSIWQCLYTLTAIILKPRWLKQVSVEGRQINFEKIPGSDLIWDIAEMAEQNKYSIFLLGGYGNTPTLVGQKLQARFPKVNIVGTSEKNPDDTTVIQSINTLKPDILLVAYGPIKQERWISENKSKLASVKLLAGLGGTFDYIAGKKIQPPKFIRSIGLEWLWRLFTQPSRAKRIWLATFGLSRALVRYKVFNSYPLRDNVVCVILSDKNEILVCKRIQSKKNIFFGILPEEMEDHWQFPQGGLDLGEDILQAAKRECKEEIGSEEVKHLYTSPKTHTYLWNFARRKLLKNNSRHKGQKQNIVYFRFTGSKENIRVDNKEFSEYKWVPEKMLKDTIHSLKMPLVDIALEDLKTMREKAII